MLISLFLALHSVLAPSATENFFVGTYTSPDGSHGIYKVALNSETGELSDPVLAGECAQPSFLALDSTGKHLYAVDESKDGKVNSFVVGADLNLTLLNSQSSLGPAPCHLSVAPGDKMVLAATYTGGDVVALPIRADGSLDASSSYFQNSGSGPYSERQEHSHMHSIQVDPARRHCYACDLGTDELLLFPFDKAAGTTSLSNPVRVKTPAAAGPRHLVFHPKGKFVYVANELSCTVSVYKADTKTGQLTDVQDIPTVPSAVGLHASTVAEIALHPSGKWLYVSNRGYDSVACYEIARDGLLKPLDIKKVSVHQPRGFAIDPSGKWFVVGGQSSQDLVSMPLDPKTGLLGEEGKKVAIHSPVCVLFAKS